MTEITRSDLITCTEFKLPKGTYRGEFHDSKDGYVGDLHLSDHKVYIVRKKECGRGEVVAMFPETLDPKLFCKTGGYQLYASTWVQFYALKPEVIAIAT